MIQPDSHTDISLHKRRLQLIFIAFNRSKVISTVKWSQTSRYSDKFRFILDWKYTLQHYERHGRFLLGVLRLTFWICQQSKLLIAPITQLSGRMDAHGHGRWFIWSHFACRRDAVRFVSLLVRPASNCLTIINQTRIIPARARLWSSNFLPMQIGERMTQRAWLCSFSINLLTLVLLLLNSFNFNYIHNYI